MLLKVPLLDLQAQYRPLREEILAAMTRVADSQRFIMGPEIDAVERELGALIGVRHAIALSLGTPAAASAFDALLQYFRTSPDGETVKGIKYALGSALEKTALEMANITLRNANEDMANTKSLYAKGFVTGADIQKSELALTNAEGRHAATVLGDDLSAVVRFKPGDIALWDPLPFQIVEDQLHRWRDVALGAVRAAASAGAADGESLEALSARLVTLQRAWETDATLESHAETFRHLDIATPLRSKTSEGDPLRPVRGALTYLAQFRERGLPRPLVDWLASGDPRARVATARVAVPGAHRCRRR